MLVLEASRLTKGHLVRNFRRAVTSNAATLSVCPGPGDMNGDGLVNAADIGLFIAALLAG